MKEVLAVVGILAVGVIGYAVYMQNSKEKNKKGCGCGCGGDCGEDKSIGGTTIALIEEHQCEPRFVDGYFQNYNPQLNFDIIKGGKI